MLKLKPLTTCSKMEFDKIHASKNNPHKKNLETLSQGIHARYDVYSFHFNDNSFEKIPKIEYQHLDSLKSCYNSSTDALDELKISIKKKQLNISHKICQYCGINTDDQIDHYLPKEDYADFNVNSLNMIPCCGRCNLKKSQYWLDDSTNEKGIINLYRDELIKDQYLHCKIQFIEGNFIGYYYLENRTNISSKDYRLICNHYRQLELIERYNDLLTGLYESEQRIINTLKLTQTDNQIKESLVLLSKSDSEALGANNYKVVARKAIAEIYPF